MKIFKESKMGWQEEFVETFYEVVNQENVTFSKLNKNMNTDDWCPGSVVGLKERHWQYLLFKGLLANNYFDRWIIKLEQAYSGKRNAPSRRRHVDFILAETKYRKADYELQICIEMKEGFRGVEDDYHRLTQYSNPNRRGLLVYKFSKNPVGLEGKIDESPEFKRKKNEFKITSKGDMEVNVVTVGGNHERYHFEAVLLSW
jgi:hypothetical protein